jgi:hypothetical protein
MLRFVGLVRRIAAQGSAKGARPAALQSARIDVLQFHPGKEKDHGHNLVPQSHCQNPKSGRRGLPRFLSKLVRPLVLDVAACRVPPASRVVHLSRFLDVAACRVSQQAGASTCQDSLSRLAVFPQQAGASTCQILGCRGLPRSPSKPGHLLDNYSSICSTAQIV